MLKIRLQYTHIQRLSKNFTNKYNLMYRYIKILINRLVLYVLYCILLNHNVFECLSLLKNYKKNKCLLKWTLG